MNMGTELKPCPFCGGTDLTDGSITFGHGDYGKTIKCRSCLVEMPDDYMGKTAAQKWNSRAPTSPMVSEYGVMKC